ncbi:MAG: putative selenium-dependent hydroxylase accessory protein YqeC [Moritella sp.]|jgi:probable selenium-dependent hydroxylase accessory protein YqeC
MPLSMFSITQTTPRVIALVGAGGKTSTAFWLAQQFKQHGHCVLVSTTTKMFHPKADQADHFISDSDSNIDSNSNADNQFDCLIPEQTCNTLLSRLQNQKTEPSITFCFQREIQSTDNSAKKKVIGIVPGLVNQLKNNSPFTVFIIEADGAHCKPLKAPDRHEPCLPLCSDMVIGITGAESINTPANADNIHRWNTFSELTQCSQGDLIDHRVLQRLIAHPQGMFKHAPAHARKVWLINKVDLAPSYQQLIKTAQTVIAGTDQLDEIWLTTMLSISPIKDIIKK